jgi:hypothetical protein
MADTELLKFDDSGQLGHSFEPEGNGYSTTLEIPDGVSGADGSLMPSDDIGSSQFGTVETEAVEGSSATRSVDDDDSDLIVETKEAPAAQQRARAREVGRLQTTLGDQGQAEILDSDTESATGHGALCTLANDLARLSPEQRLQQPCYKGEVQDGEHFSDVRFSHEGREYIALTPFPDTLPKFFDQRVNSLSWEGVDTPPSGVEMGITYDDTPGSEVIICSPAPGRPTWFLSPEEIRTIPDNHVEGIVPVAEYHANHTNCIDPVGHNFFYDKEVGFTVIDCEPAQIDDPLDAEVLFSDFILGLAGPEDLHKPEELSEVDLAWEELRSRAKSVQQRYWARNDQQ